MEQNSQQSEKLTFSKEIQINQNIPIPANHLNSLNQILQSLKLTDTSKLHLEAHWNNVNLYLEFSPLKHCVSCNDLESTFQNIFVRKSNQYADKLIEPYKMRPYKLFIGANGLKMEVETAQSQLKLFRFIIPLS